jgi:hypothetical protein
MIKEEWFIKEQKEIQKILSKSKSISKVFKESEVLKEKYGLSIETERICSILNYIDYSKERNKYRNEEELIKIINNEKYFEIVDILTAKLKDLKEEEKYSKDFETIEDKLYSIIFNKDYVSDYSEFIKWKKTFKDEKRIAANILDKFFYVLFHLEKDIRNNFDSSMNILNIDSFKIKQIFKEFIKNEGNVFRIKCFNIEIKNQYEEFDEIIVEDFIKQKSELIDLISIHPTLNLVYEFLLLYEGSNSDFSNNLNEDGVVSSIKKGKELNINF